MKTTFFKIATVLLILIAATNSFAANPVNTRKYTGLNWITGFYKIEVHGNVQLHLITGEKTKIEMNSNYYNHNALVQVENGILRITCYRAERLNVWVTVNDLRALSAYDNVIVQSEGKFSSLEFEVELFNKAKANLDLDCYSANIKLNDHSLADISGTATESELAINYAATLNSANFLAEQLSCSRVAPVWETNIAFERNTDTDLIDNLTGDNKELQFSSASKKPIKFDIPSGIASFQITQRLTK